MKKALLLGVLTLFVINIATVQTVNAQDRQPKTAKTTKSDGNKKVVKPKVATMEASEAKKEVKADNKKTGSSLKVNSNSVEPKKAESKKVEPAKPVSTQDNDNTSKKVKKEVGVPPTPNKTKQSQSNTTKPNAGGDK